MAAAILRGDPDALLTQPKAVLPRLFAGESLAHGWGDLVTGSATLATLAGLDAARLPLTMLAVALGVAVYASAVPARLDLPSRKGTIRQGQHDLVYNGAQAKDRSALPQDAEQLRRERACMGNPAVH
jgi:hypothetical protein